ncbi:MAG: BBP7 family outer membrane beta-barrel protein [Gemmataceae bacterium]|nr:BBP7 family outer membrane beta-barrel protein [Gemmataceae bacterium]
MRKETVALALVLHAGLAWAQVAPSNSAKPSRTVVLSGPAPLAPPDATPGAGADCFSDAPPRCERKRRFWVNGEYLYWWIKGAPLPVPLLTSSAPADSGILGRPSTQIVIGGDSLDNDERGGGRFSAGFWLDAEQRLGLEGSYLFLGSRSANHFASVPGDRAGVVIAVPFQDANPATSGESSALVSSPNAFSGSADLRVASRLWGAELNGLVGLGVGRRWRTDLLVGFRYLDLAESLNFRTSSPDFPPATPDDVFVTFDGFDARNRFYGGQLGARVEWRSSRFFVRATGKVALGSVRQEVDIGGNLRTNDFTGSTGPPMTFPGGYFAQRTNVGTYGQNQFAVVPEATISVGYEVTRRARVFVGYTFLYLSEAARPGNQLDRVINSSQSESILFTPTPGGLVGPRRPAFGFRDDDFWAQGINFGLELRF